MKKIPAVFMAAVMMCALTSCSVLKSDITGDTQTTAAETAIVPAEAQITAAYEKAAEIYYYFEVSSLEVDSAATVEDAGKTYYKVKDYSTLNELKAYMGSVLSEGLIEKLIDDNADIYREFDGVLYSIDGARGTDITLGGEKVSIIQNNDTGFTVIVTVEKLGEDLKTVTGFETHNDIYENVNGKWVFTVFDYFR